MYERTPAAETRQSQQNCASLLPAAVQQAATQRTLIGDLHESKVPHSPRAAVLVILGLIVNE